MKFPLQFIRTGAVLLLKHPSLIEFLIRNFDLTLDMVTKSDPDINMDRLWKICEQIRLKLGAAWYLRFPVLWSADLDGVFETAVRIAPTPLDMMQVCERYGTQRWPFARWEVKFDKKYAYLRVYRVTPVPGPEWEMMYNGFRLRFFDMIRRAFPEAWPHWNEKSEFACPLPEDEMNLLLGKPITWNASESVNFLPIEYLHLPSLVSDPASFAHLIETLEAQNKPVITPWSVSVANVLSDAQDVRLGARAVAEKLGLSVRSLERRLVAEGTSFARLRDDELVKRFRRLSTTTELGIGEIADRLGYCDESALSKATRRWLNCSAAEARAQMRAGAPL